MLDSHPELAIPPETYFAPDVIAACRRGASAAELIEMLGSHRRWGDFDLPAAELRNRLERLDRITARGALRAFYELYAERHGKPRWGDKTPRYIRSMPEIAGALPEARFVHLIRDGRDTAVSKSEREPDEPMPIRRQARRWKRRIRKARSQAAGLEHYIEARYEDLVREPEAVLRRVSGFIELDFDQAMLSYHERAGERLSEIDRDLPATGSQGTKEAGDRLAGFTLVAKPPTEERIGRWRAEMSEADRVEFERIAGDLLDELGYETGNAQTS